MNLVRTLTGITRGAAAAAILLALASPGYAQKKPSANAIDTAREIILLKGAATIFDPLVPGVIEQSKVSFLQQNPALQKDLDEIAATLRTEYAPRIKDVLNEVAARYAGFFTEAELKDLLAFYKSPLGKKSVADEPRALEQGVNYAQEWAVKFSDEVVARMRAELKKKGRDM
ncbi:MAG: DUF2059 domain-containing protein [Pseudolabrys sp.]